MGRTAGPLRRHRPGRPKVATENGPARRAHHRRTKATLLKPQRLPVRTRSCVDVLQIGSLCRYVTHARVLVPETRLPRRLRPMWRRNPGVGQGFQSPIRPDLIHPPTTDTCRGVHSRTTRGERDAAYPVTMSASEETPHWVDTKPIKSGAVRASSNLDPHGSATPHKPATGVGHTQKQLSGRSRGPPATLRPLTRSADGVNAETAPTATTHGRERPPSVPPTPPGPAGRQGRTRNRSSPANSPPCHRSSGPEP